MDSDTFGDKRLSHGISASIRNNDVPKRADRMP